MTTPVFEKASSLAGPAVGAIVGSILSVVGMMIASNFTSQSSAMAIEVREHDNAIADLKPRVIRLEGFEEALQHNHDELMGAVQNLKNANDTAVSKLNDIEKRFNAWDDVYRPLRVPGSK